MSAEENGASYKDHGMIRAYIDINSGTSLVWWQVLISRDSRFGYD
jgi:hypothetical protein